MISLAIIIAIAALSVNVITVVVLRHVRRLDEMPVEDVRAKFAQKRKILTARRQQWLNSGYAWNKEGDVKEATENFRQASLVDDQLLKLADEEAREIAAARDAT